MWSHSQAAKDQKCRLALNVNQTERETYRHSATVRVPMMGVIPIIPALCFITVGQDFIADLREQRGLLFNPLNCTLSKVNLSAPRISSGSQPCDKINTRRGWRHCGWVFSSHVQSHCCYLFLLNNWLLNHTRNTLQAWFTNPKVVTSPWSLIL